MKRTIFRTGNSYAITLPRELLEDFGLGAGSQVTLEPEPDGTSIRLTPIARADNGIDQEFAQQVDEFISRYHVALERLADR